jgi:hypothetical protein
MVPLDEARLDSLGYRKDKVLTYGIFALIARDGLNSIILNCGSNRVVAKFVASARGKGFRATAVRILARRFIRKAKNLFSHNFIERAIYHHSSCYFLSQLLYLFMRHGLKVRLTVIDPFLRKFDPGFLRIVRVGKGLIDSQGFKHTFTVFTVRHKNVRTPTLGIVHSLKGDLDMMAFVVHAPQRLPSPRYHLFP